jgi:type IV pilus assembly protein PilA
MRAYKRIGKEGFTLVELMIVVAIIGVLAALAIYGVSRYFANAKTAEAKNTIGAIARAAAAAYEREQSVSEILGGGVAGAQSTFALCGQAAKKIPDSGIPAGTKINPDPADQTATAETNGAADGWACLRFNLNQPVAYQYSYMKDNSVTTGLPGAPAYAGSYFEAAAQGDLDADTNLSTFARGGQIQTDGSLTLATQVYINEEYE